MSDSREKFNQFVDMPTGKTVGAIVLKFLSATNLTLKVDHFDGFVSRSRIADFMIMKTSRCNFLRNFLKEVLISI